MKATQTKFIETPLTKFVGGEDKIIWPWIFVVLTIGGFISVMVLW